jgi:hypothetical protein
MFIIWVYHISSNSQQLTFGVLSWKGLIAEEIAIFTKSWLNRMAVMLRREERQQFGVVSMAK